MSKALTNDKVSHKELTITLDEAGNYRRLKVNIRMVKNQRSRRTTDNLIKDGEEVGNNEIIKPNERIKS